MFLWEVMILIALCKSVHFSPTQTADNKSSDTVSPLCEEDWIQYGTKCYKFVKRRVFREEASASCNTMGGHLASIHSKAESDFINGLLKTQNFLMEYLTPYRWIGLRDNNLMHEFVWEDGSQFQYTNWDQLEPYGAVTCVAIYFPDYLKVGKWRLVQCFLKLPYLCQRKIPTTALTRKEEADNSIYLFPNQTAENNSVEGLSLCEENWKQYGQLCYKLEKRGLSWEKAAASCVTMGGYLASIHSKEQSDFVNGLISTHINLWDNPGSYRWIGLRENGSKYNFEWQDESQFDFTNWLSNEPNNRKPILCAAVFFPDGDSNGKWMLVLCHILLPYVCQKQIPTPGNASTEEDDTPVPTTEIASTEKFGASVQTSVIPNKQNDYEPGLHNYLSLFKEQFDLVRTTTYTSNEDDSSLGSISVTSFTATIIVIITLLVLMGGIIYHRQTWLKEKRMSLHRVLFRSTLTDTV